MRVKICRLDIAIAKRHVPQLMKDISKIEFVVILNVNFFVENLYELWRA